MFHAGYFVREEEMFVTPKNIYKSSYHYVHFNIGFSVGGGVGVVVGWGGGGGGCLLVMHSALCALEAQL